MRLCWRRLKQPKLGKLPNRGSAVLVCERSVLLFGERGEEVDIFLVLLSGFELRGAYGIYGGHTYYLRSFS
jgi:hypothetical protein